VGVDLNGPLLQLRDLLHRHLELKNKPSGEQNRDNQRHDVARDHRKREVVGGEVFQVL
jgi:hypothetical protein